MKNISILVMIAWMTSCTSGERKAGNSGEINRDAEDAIRSVEITKSWTSDAELLTCESTLYDKERDIIYVSNIHGNPTEKNGQGFISRLTTEGIIEQLHWIEGLHAPKGMAVDKGYLYVTDIDVLVKIDIAQGIVADRYPVDGASFLNDVAVDDHGRVFFTDSDTGIIHVLHEGSVSAWKQDARFARPNGLFHYGTSLLLALSGSGQLLSIDYGSGAIEVLAEGIGRGDGIAPDGKGNIFVSNWEGQVFLITAKGKVLPVLDTRDQERNSADIDYIIDKNLLLVPTFFKNAVDAYSVRYR